MNIEELKQAQLDLISKWKKYNVTGTIIIATIIIISFILICVLGDMMYGALVIFELAFLVIIFFIVREFKFSKKSKELKDEFKNVFVLNALKSVFSDLIYSPDSGLNESVIRDTGMMNMGDRYSSNDYISGKYKNISVTQADIHIEEEHETTDSEGHTHTYWVTVFKGRWMIFDFNKSFKANIRVCHKGFFNGRLYRKGSDLKYQKVMMDDQDFNNNFSVFAQNEHDVFYILTPSLMEKIKNITSKTNCGIMFCFIDNKLHVAINNYKDSFEYNLLKPINEEEINKEITKDIKLITDFIDELDLDNDLFKRQ